MPRFVALLLLALCSCTAARAAEPMPPAQLPSGVVEDLLDKPEPLRLKAYHEALGLMPHDAGTAGDRRVIDLLAEWFGSFGLEVELQELELLLHEPVDATVQVLPTGEDPIDLPLREEPVETDAGSTIASLRPGWNAWSASGDVTGEVVYANYGRLEDFRKLKELGIDIEDTIVLARYGGNYRGYKARFAEEAGAAGLIMYTDPADSGYARGMPYPEGGWANASYIQRGSIKTAPYSGDPFTPGRPSEPGATRIPPAEVDGLPNIPAQPIGWGAAEQILARMTGPGVPNAWQGGLGFRYRLTGGDDLRVRLAVQQNRRETRTANVMGTLRGRERPEEAVIIGSHHDAWGFGAGDPLAGLITVIEAARVFGEMADEGWRPKRSIVFAGWAAEEHGLIGSVEYVESRPEWLTENAVAYLNLDMAAMGPNFSASASPSLAPAILEAASLVPQPGTEGAFVLDAWRARTATPADAMPGVRDLGGGSDHVGFLCHLCIPSAGLGGRGSDGVAYHSIYDSLDWYQTVVGDDYESARMITRMAGLTAAMLADGDAPPLRASEYADAVERHIDRVSDLAAASNAIPEKTIDAARERISAAAATFERAVGRAERQLANQPDQLAALHQSIERSWCDGAFDDGRAWYRNGFAAPDATSGYASWMVPGLRNAIHERDAAAYETQATAIADALEENAAAAQAAVDGDFKGF